MRDRLGHIFKDAAQLYGVQVLGLIVSFGMSLVVARLLGPDGRGAYGWIMAVFAVAIQIAQLGGDTLNRRLGAQSPQLGNVLAGNALVQALLWASCVGLGMIVFGLTQDVGNAYWGALLVAGAMLPANVIHGLLGSLSAGLGHVKPMAWAELVQRVTLVLATGLAVMFLQLEVIHLFLAMGLAWSVAALVQGRYLTRLVGWPWRIEPGLFWQNRALLVGFFGAGLAWIVLQKIDIVLLGMWRPLEETGYYTVALTLVDAMVMLPGAIAFVLMPRLAAELHGPTRNRLLLVMLAVVMGAFGAACLLAGVLSPWFIPKLFGADFTAAVGVFQRLLWACWLMGGYYVCQQAVAGYGRARHQMLAPLVGLVVKVGFGWVFISHGMLAAANATVLGYGAAFVVALTVALTSSHKR